MAAIVTSVIMKDKIMNKMIYMLSIFAIMSIGIAVAQDNKSQKRCASFDLVECTKCCKEKYKNHPRREAKIRECIEYNCPTIHQPFVGETTTVK